MEQKDQFKKDAKAFNNCAFVHEDNKYLRFIIIYANNIFFQVCILKKNALRSRNLHLNKENSKL